MRHSLELEIIGTGSFKYSFHKIVSYNEFLNSLDELLKNSKSDGLYSQYIEKVAENGQAEETFLKVIDENLKEFFEKSELQNSLNIVGGESLSKLKGIELGTDFSLIPFNEDTKMAISSYDNKTEIESRFMIDLSLENNRKQFIILNSKEEVNNLQEEFYLKKLFNDKECVDINGSIFDISDQRFNGLVLSSNYFVNYSPSFYMMTDQEFSLDLVKVILFQQDSELYIVDILYDKDNFGISKIEMNREELNKSEFKLFKRDHIVV